MENLTTAELINLISKVFPRFNTDLKLAILIDVPDNLILDNPDWKLRRQLAADWAIQLQRVKTEIRLAEITAFYYQNVHNNNADLPLTAHFYDGPVENLNFQKLCSVGSPIDFKIVFENYQLFLAPTEFSATAPLKLAARKYGFRAATMPGFSSSMIPALKLDYEKISHRVKLMKSLVDRAVGTEINFQIQESGTFQLYLDLRYRESHESSGCFPEKGTAGNLPSGECYIVPYEGERGEPSQSAGLLPVQFDEEIVIYRIEKNRAVEVVSTGAKSEAEAKKIQAEPAYSNLAELGFGVLADFGVKPVGEILLDEKLGLHLAFGRSDHFGGVVGPADFSNAYAVEHIDRIYIPETQSWIKVLTVDLKMTDGEMVQVMKNGNYTLF